MRSLSYKVASNRPVHGMYKYIIVHHNKQVEKLEKFVKFFNQSGVIEDNERWQKNTG